MLLSLPQPASASPNASAAIPTKKTLLFIVFLLLASFIIARSKYA